ncbi:hypothetical protein PLICRDRAFT_260852 [Plicaturopsis crispa FD-325 SS-3]|nr:hypothetical protein PLICRDRAFT_260852 [Plicaturopsis crispa FD-325 SS-3]
MDIIAVMDLQAGPPAVGYYMALELDSLWHVTRRSHPNICEYLGCVLDGQHITGLCFKRYKCTLHDAIEHRMPLDFYSVTSGIASGVQHLHSMGLVHGNLKPTNIMLDDDDTPIIIDFDQCQKSGATLSYKRGTPGWCPDPLPSIARFETDLYAMDRIFQYLQERTAPFHAGTAENTPSTMTIKLSFR